MKTYDEYYEMLKTLHYEEKHAEVLSLLENIDIIKEIPSEEQWKFFELTGMTYGNMGDMAHAVKYLKKAIYFPGNMTINVQKRIYSQYIFFLHCLPDFSDAALYDECIIYNNLFSGAKQYIHRKRKTSSDKIRIGYLVPNKARHIVYRFIKPLLKDFDPDRYEIICYSKGPMLDPYKIEHDSGQPIHWTNINDMPPLQAAERIFNDNIDILVDFEGHTNGGWGLRIAGYKPAPIQMEGIGYFNTTGLETMDYFLGDIYCDPPRTDKFFCEKILRMPHSHLCYFPEEYLSNYVVHHKDHDNVVFGSFNNFDKISDEVLRIWYKIIHRVKDSKVVLKNIKKDTYLLKNMRKLQVEIEQNYNQETFSIV